MAKLRVVRARVKGLTAAEGSFSKPGLFISGLPLLCPNETVSKVIVANPEILLQLCCFIVVATRVFSTDAFITSG